jgi:hypothetical protein
MNGRKLVPKYVGRAVSRYVCLECRSYSSAAQHSRWRPVVDKQKELGSKTWSRGAKRQTTLTVKARTQGSLPAKPIEPVDENDGPIYSTVIQQVRNNMNKFSHCVVLTRVGNFYEVRIRIIFFIRLILKILQLYFEHAEEYGPLLSLKVAQRRTRASTPPVAMVSLPFA